MNPTVEGTDCVLSAIESVHKCFDAHVQAAQDWIAALSEACTTEESDSESDSEETQQQQQ